MQFLELEAAYIIIAIFFLVITAIVTTRSFSPKNSFKKVFPVVFIISFIMIMLHYNITTSRMAEVEDEFSKGETILCENRTKSDVSKSIRIDIDHGWTLKNHVFSNPDYIKSFHSARCVKMLDVMKKAEKNALKPKE